MFTVRAADWAPLPQLGRGCCGRRLQLLLLLLLLAACCVHGHHTNRFVFCLQQSDFSAAVRIARNRGFGLPVKVLDRCYEVEHTAVSKRSLQSSDHHVRSLLSSEGVEFAEQQFARRRTKRDAVHRSYRAPPYSRTPIYLNDPRWMQMWYLNRGGRLDMNVQEAWRLGYTGRGVVVTILDDGLEKDHPDLKDNYDAMASFDVNDRDTDPQPRYDLAHTNRHGTRCAGEVAAIANNSICGVGIAFNSNIGGVRMLDGEVTDAVEARSLSLNPQHIDIYSASWGPDDDGRTVDGPGELAKRAFKDGIVHGRGGKGSIFVWASGNGGREQDNCNCDGYTNSMWTLSISSATEYGHVPWYSEACSSTLATTYSSGSGDESKIVTTDLQNGCTTKHTGTSASAPLAAGICALALEANPELSWRDMQHIVVRTAHKANLQASDWTTNGVGLNVSHSFGFGLMDAAAMVKLAKRWKPVALQKNCQASSGPLEQLVRPHDRVVLTLRVLHCGTVKYLEHVQARVTLDARVRGDIEIFLKSPSGTISTVLKRRPRDQSRVGFRDWPFMTTHNWGESPLGEWTLEVHNVGSFQASVSNWKVVMFGTEVEAGTAPSSGDTGSPTGDAASTLPDRHTPTAGSSSSSSSAAPPLWRHLPGCVLGDPRALADCLECNSSMLLSAGHCVWHCPLSTYREHRACLSCHYTCATCRSSVSCSSCRAGDAVWPDSGLCVSVVLLDRLRSSSPGWSHSSELLLVAVTALVVAGVLLVLWHVRRSRQRRQQQPPTEVVAFTDEEDGSAAEFSSEKSKLLENSEE